MNPHKYSISSIVYYPPSIFYEQLDYFLLDGYEIFIYDNTPHSDVKQNPFYGKKGINIYGCGINIGLGSALNVIAELAYNKGFDHLFFLDQDTLLSNRTITYICEYYNNKIYQKLDDFAVICFTGEASVYLDVVDVKLAINSGSLFNLKILKMNNWHNKNYFVDLVDYEYCIRVRSNNFRIGKVFNVVDFDHRTGQPDDEINFLKKSILIRKYPLTRLIDCYSSYFKLFFYCFRKTLVFDFILLLKSFLLYSFMFFVSRFKI